MKKKEKIRNAMSNIGKENPTRHFTAREMLGEMNQYGIRFSNTVERVSFYLRTHPDFGEVGRMRSHGVRIYQYKTKTALKAI